MKRRLSTDLDTTNPTDQMSVGSPVRKQARADVAQVWDTAAAVSQLRAMCQRASDGSANADDLRQMLRLAMGGMIGGVVSAWRAADRDPLSGRCETLVVVYQYLWRDLASDNHAEALAAVRKNAEAWPPTFDDVVRTYVAADPDAATRYMNLLESRTRNDSIVEIINELVDGLDTTLRRNQMLGAGHTSPSESYMTPFATGDWAPVVDSQSVTRIGGCNPDARYFILGLNNNYYDIAALFAINPDYNEARLVDAAIVHLNDPLTAVQRFSPEVDRTQRDNADLVTPNARRPYATLLLPFLASIAALQPHHPAANGLEEESRDAFAVAAGLFDPTPAGAQQIKAVMVPIASRFALPNAVRDYIDGIYDDPDGDWYSYRMRGTLIDECRLVLALRLFEAQVGARQAAQRYVPTTLAARSAKAYAGPLLRGTAPDEVLNQAGAYAWQGTCAAPALPSGRLPNANRLLDVAALWGIQPDAGEAERPELLCNRLRQFALGHNTVMSL